MAVQKRGKKKHRQMICIVYIYFLIIPRIQKLNLLHSTVCEKKVLRR